jgi:sugar phosphate isomerase/epimerase
MSRKPAAVQLWTLRQEIAADLPAALRRVAEIGYQGVEAWFANWPPAEALKAALADSGLKVVGAHVPFVELRDGFDAVAAYHRALGNSDVAIPMIPEELRRGEDDWKLRVEEIAAIARRCKEAGLRLSYHNHAMEFEETVGGVDAHDYIFATVGSDLLKAELDTYFIKHVGKDPAEYIRRYAGRGPLLHLKDESKDPRFANTEVGSGTVDWDAVLSAAESAGVEWYIVEQNSQGMGALESIAVSYEFLRSRGAV